MKIQDTRKILLLCEYLSGAITLNVSGGNCNTVEPFYNGHLRTKFSGRCREVAVMGRFSIRGFECMGQKLGQENMAVKERWPLWGCGRSWRFDCVTINKN